MYFERTRTDILFLYSKLILSVSSKNANSRLLEKRVPRILPDVTPLKELYRVGILVLFHSSSPVVLFRVKSFSLKYPHLPEQFLFLLLFFVTGL